MAGIDDTVKDGDTVLARFTNSGHIYQFEGIVVGRAKNYWKIQAIQSPYPDDSPNRVFHVESELSRKWSANNRIVSILPKRE